MISAAGDFTVVLRTADVEVRQVLIEAQIVEATDTFARMFARYLETKYKQPVIVENKTGAGQVVGANYAILDYASR